MIIPGVQHGMKQAGLREELPIVLRSHSTPLEEVMPAGSVRALLTLLVVAVVAVRLIQNLDLGLWRETLMIVLAHYFTSRSIGPRRQESRNPPRCLRDE